MKFWEEDLPTPTAMPAELKEWIAHWEKRPAQSHPVSLLGCLQHADEDHFAKLCQAAPVHWLHTASWECGCTAILQCFPKDQNVPAKQDVTRLSFGNGSDACPPWSPCRHEEDMPEIHPDQQEEDVPVQHHQTESRLKGLPNQRTVLYWSIYLNWSV